MHALLSSLPAHRYPAWPRIATYLLRFASLGLILSALILGTAPQPVQAGNNIWTSIGPEGGSINGLVVDPKTPATLYAATSRAVFKSTDGGDSWAYLSGWSFSTLAIDPVTPTTLYAGTYQSGIFKNAEFYKSTDSGVTWTLLYRGLETVITIAVNPANPNIVYVGRAYDGILWSIDGGANWGGGANFSKSIYAIAPDPVNTNIVYAATPDAGVFKSVDHGTNWSAINTGLVSTQVWALVVDPTHPSTVYAGTNGGGVYKTTNSGASWSAASMGMNDTGVTNLTMDPINPAVLYAATYASADGIARIYKTSNSGASWSEIYASPAESIYTSVNRLNALVVAPLTPTKIYAGTSGGGIVRSTDSGGNWQVANHGLTDTCVQAFKIDPTNPTTFYAGTTNSLFKSTDSGANWTKIINGLTDPRIVALAIDPQTPTTLYAGTDSSGVFKSTDGGANWAVANTGASNQFMNALVIDPQTPTTLYLSSWSDGVAKTTNGGQSWQTNNTGLTTTNVQSLAIDPVHPAVLYAGTDSNGVFKSTNGGGNWTPISSGLPASATISALSVDPVNPNTVYAGRNDRVFKSTDGGATWFATNTGISAVVQTMAIDANALYVGTFDGVFKTSDGGVTWQALTLGLNGQEVKTIAIDPTNPAKLYASTCGGGVFVLQQVNAPAPTISSFSPTSGGIGTTVNIAGTNFTGTTSVTFNSVSTNFSVTSETMLQATVPTGATTGPIGVTTAGGVATSTTNFTVNTAPTAINSFTPTSGVVGTKVNITGSNFTGATAVAFNHVNATFVFVSDIMIQATVPLNATSGPIQVTTPQGSATSAALFTVSPSTTAVPNVVGMTQAAAATALAAANLKVGTVTAQVDATVPVGSVISQNPPANTTVNAGSAVDLVVSIGACNNATTLTPGVAQPATLSAPGEVDFYKFDVTQPNTTILVKLDHPNQDYDLYLYNTCTGSSDKPQDSGQARHVGEETVAFNIGTATGAYYLAVVGYNNAFSATPYTLLLNFNPDTDEPNNLCVDAVELPLDTVHNAYLSQPSDVDFYKVYVEQPYATLTVRLNHPTADFDLSFYDACVGAGGQARHVGEGRHVGEEVINYNVGAAAGWYYIQVYGFNSSYSTTPYTLQVTLTTTANSYGTLILTHRNRLIQHYGAARVDPLFEQINALAAHPTVAGLVLDVDSDPNVHNAYAAWDAAPKDAARANQVADAIKQLIQAQWQQQPTIRYLVIVGSDAIIPFYRLAIRPSGGLDTEWVYENEYLTGAAWNSSEPTVAALRNNLSLSDDFYGASLFPIPFQDPYVYPLTHPVGRLVETPEEMGAVIHNFLNRNGVMAINQPLAAGGDFVGDAADAACDLLNKDGITPVCSTTPDWNDSWLRAELMLGPQVATIDTHANHFSFLAPGGGQVTAREIASLSTLNGVLLYSLGCQAGLNVPPGSPNELDLPEAVASLGGSMLGNTGWGYGIVGGFGLEETLIRLFTTNLVQGNSAVLGDALMDAKRSYYLYKIRHNYYDQKVVSEFTLYGLPMWRISTPGSAGITAATAPHSLPANAAPTQVVALVSPAMQAGEPGREERLLWFNDTDFAKEHTDWGNYYTYRDDVRAEPGFTLQPTYAASTYATSGPIHGIALTGGAYTDERDFDPVLVMPRNPNAPAVGPEAKLTNAQGWLPSQFFGLQRLPGIAADEIAEGLVVDLGQFRPQTATTGIERRYNYVSLMLYRSDSTDWAPPTIDSIQQISQSKDIQLTVKTTDTAGIYGVSVAYTNGNGAWQKIDLTSVDQTTWQGSLPAGGDLVYLVQAVDTAGNVTVASDGPCAPCGSVQRVFLPLVATKP